MDRLQILKDLRDSTDALLKSKKNADGKAIERCEVLQEIGDPKKAAHAKWHTSRRRADDEQ